MNEIMDVTDIAFPHLHIYLENVPKTVTVFGFSIAFYGLIIGMGVIENPNTVTVFGTFSR